MSIREDARKILRCFLDKAIEYGDLNMISSDFSFSYDSLSKDLDFKDWKYCRICCQYLTGHAYMEITTPRTESSIDESSRQRLVILYSSAIDFLETAMLSQTGLTT